MIFVEKKQSAAKFGTQFMKGKEIVRKFSGRMGVANLREKTPAGHPAELVIGGW